MNHEKQFRKSMGAKQKSEAKRKLAVKWQQLTQAERRIEKLDRLFKRIYKDNVDGKLSDSRFKCFLTITSRSRKNRQKH